MCVHIHAYVYEYICICEFRYQLPMVHAGRSEDNLEYQSSPSVWFETGLLVCCSVHHAWQDTGNSLVSISHLSAGALELECMGLVVYGSWGFTLKASCLHGKLFTYWTIPEPTDKVFVHVSTWSLKYEFMNTRIMLINTWQWPTLSFHSCVL